MQTSKSLPPFYAGVFREEDALAERMQHHGWLETRLQHRLPESRLVFRNLAFLGDESHWAAVAASLAADQNKFWELHDYLFTNFQGSESGGYHIDRLLEMGEAVGLDMDQFRDGLKLENARERWAEIEAILEST